MISVERAFMAQSSSDSEYFDAHRVAVGIHVGLFRRHARSPHLRMLEHGLHQIVAQRFLQMNMTLLDAARNGRSHEVVVDDFGQLVFNRRGQRERHEAVRR